MKRRQWLQLGLAGTAVLAVARGVTVWSSHGLQAHGLSPSSRALFAALADTLLHGTLPADPAARAQAVSAHLGRLQTAVAGLPAAVQDELSTVLRLLETPAGRWLLAGRADDWRDMGRGALADTLAAMRASSLTVRQQAYLALRELTVAAYFSDSATWPALGYPGPVPV